MRTDPPPLPRWKAILFSLIGMALVLGMLELAAGLIIGRFAQTGTFGARVLQNNFHPFLGWEHPRDAALDTSKPGSAPSLIRTDGKGRSITPLATAKPRLMIVVTGGSTMFGVGSTDNSTTVPSLLEKKIKDRLGLEVEVVNLAVRGYRSFQEMLALQQYLVEERADLVLAVSGRNDAFAAFIDPDPQYALLPRQVWTEGAALVRKAEQQQPIVLNPLGYLRQASSLADLLARVALRVTSAAVPAQDGEAGPPARADLANVGPRSLLTAEHYAAMKAMTEMQGGRFHMVLQPTAYTVPEFDLSRLTDRPLAAHQAQKAYENAFYQSLAGYLVRLDGLDLSHAIDGDPRQAYVDNCHYTDEGADRLAGRILDALEPEITRLAREKAQ